MWLKEWIFNPFDRNIKSEELDLKSGFHDLLWPKSNNPPSTATHWIRKSLFNIWNRLQHRISPDISPLKIPTESYSELTKDKLKATLTYKDLADRSRMIRSYQEITNNKK